MSGSGRSGMTLPRYFRRVVIATSGATWLWLLISALMSGWTLAGYAAIGLLLGANTAIISLAIDMRPVDR